MARHYIRDTIEATEGDQGGPIWNHERPQRPGYELHTIYTPLSHLDAGRSSRV